MSKLQDLPPDSLRLICTQFDHLYDLTVLARTCRLLSQHAVREIWRVIPSFAVLAYTLPPDAWISTCKLLSRDETLLLWAEKVYTLVSNCLPGDLRSLLIVVTLYQPSPSHARSPLAT